MSKRRKMNDVISLAPVVRANINEYIAQGESKIKFVTSCTGSGKTYLLRFMCNKAQEK